MADQSESVFIRKSTGLVREATFFDALIFNLACASSLTAGLSVGLFWAFSVYPQTNIILALVLAPVLCIGVYVTWGMLSAAVPRAGGDYTWISRLVNPLLGWVSSFCTFWSNTFALVWWAMAVTSVALVPTFFIWGSLTGSEAMLNLGETLTQPGPSLVVGIIFIAVVGLVSAWGLKKSLIVENISYIIAFVGLGLALIVMLTTTQAQFVDQFNAFAESYTGIADSYNHVVEVAQENGLVTAAQAGFSGSQTVKTLYITFLLVIWTFGSAYLSGEMKGANSSRRQVLSMLGAGFIEMALVALATWLFFRTTGYEFFSSLNFLHDSVPAEYPFPGPPFYSLLSSIIADTPLIRAIIVFSIIGTAFPGAYILLSINIRVMFAWAFDGLMPFKLAEVNERTHSPVVAIVVNCVVWLLLLFWAIFASAGFFQVWSLIALFGFIYIGLVGLAGALFPFTQTKLYENSPAKFEILGIPLITIAGVLDMAVCIFAAVLLLTSPELLGGPGVLQVFLTTAAGIAIAVVLFFIIKAIRASQGIDLDLVYKEIPPE